MARFKQFLRAEDRVVFDDLIAQCRLYSSSAGVLASSIREVPLLLSMVFAQHKKLMELETPQGSPLGSPPEIQGFSFSSTLRPNGYPRNEETRLYEIQT